jgi:hypothetical protein
LDFIVADYLAMLQAERSGQAIFAARRNGRLDVGRSSNEKGIPELRSPRS